MWFMPESTLNRQSRLTRRRTAKSNCEIPRACQGDGVKRIK
jgi:hypothetical protein